MKRKAIFKKVSLGLAALLVAFLGVVAMQPNEFRVTRSATMAAPAEVVFAQINDFHKWQAWSPWLKLDPNARGTFSGSQAGKGAKFAWAGNNQVGEGRMEITESRLPELIRLRLDFIKPMAATNGTEFSFAPVGNNTYVTWTMTGHNNFIGKAFCLFMNMDNMVGGDFERGLASIKTIAEAASKAGAKNE